MATAGDDGTVRLWDITDPGGPVALGAPLSHHADTVWAVAFSPVGHTLASAGEDGTVRLWDVTDPRRATPLGGPLNGAVRGGFWGFSLSFTPDGRTLAVAGVQLYHLDADTAARRICRAATGVLTRSEWRKHLPDLPFTPPCR